MDTSSIPAPTSDPLSLLDQPIRWQSDGSATFGIRGRTFRLHLCETNTGKAIQTRDDQAVKAILEILQAKGIVDNSGFRANGPVTIDATGVHAPGHDLAHTEHEPGHQETGSIYQRFSTLIARTFLRTQPLPAPPTPPPAPTVTPPKKEVHLHFTNLNGEEEERVYFEDLSRENVQARFHELEQGEEETKIVNTPREPLAINLAPYQEEDADDDLARALRLSKEEWEALQQPNQAFDDYISTHFTVQTVPGDGTCLFHSCAIGTAKDGPTLRKDLYNFMLQQQAIYQPKVLTYLRNEAWEYRRANPDKRAREFASAPQALRIKYEQLAKHTDEATFERELSAWLQPRTFNTYICLMRDDPSRYPGDVEVAALGDYLEAPIHLYSAHFMREGKDPCYIHQGQGKPPPILLKYDPTIKHYDRLTGK